MRDADLSRAGLSSTAPRSASHTSAFAPATASLSRVVRVVSGASTAVPPQARGTIACDGTTTPLHGECGANTPKDDDGEAVLVVTHGDEVLATLSAHAEVFVRRLSTAKRFRASDAAAWEPSIPWDDVAMLLGEFAALGVLTRA